MPIISLIAIISGVIYRTTKSCYRDRPTTSFCVFILYSLFCHLHRKQLSRSSPHLKLSEAGALALTTHMHPLLKEALSNKPEVTVRSVQCCTTRVCRTAHTDNVRHTASIQYIPVYIAVLNGPKLFLLQSPLANNKPI